jgi:SAM-dependent methyltransferase
VREALDTATHAMPDVRSEVIARHISTSPGIHLPCDAAARRAFLAAYRWHLKGWLPADLTLPWLDLACGQGQLMTLAHDVGFRTVSGVDLSPEMLSSCREAGLAVTRGDARKYLGQLPDDTCGVVSAFDFIEHLSRNDALALLEDARRVLRPGGVMLLKLPNGASPAVGDMFFSDLTHESLWTARSFTQLATLAGFSRCEVREVGPVPHGVRSALRYVLWKGVRGWYRLLNVIETGSPGSDVVTRIMLVKLTV